MINSNLPNIRNEICERFIIPIFDNLSKFKVSLLHHGTIIVPWLHEEQVKIFSRMLRTLAKGWYLGRYKYWCKKFNIYPSINSREGSFCIRENLTIQFNHKKSNKQIKGGILMKPTKNLVITASSWWTKY